MIQLTGVALDSSGGLQQVPCSSSSVVKLNEQNFSPSSTDSDSVKILPGIITFLFENAAFEVFFTSMGESKFYGSFCHCVRLISIRFKEKLSLLYIGRGDCYDRLIARSSVIKTFWSRLFDALSIYLCSRTAVNGLMCTSRDVILEYEQNRWPTVVS